MRSKLIAGLVLALAVPSIALAAKPSPPGNSQGQHGKSAPKVVYILKGVLSGYTAANGTTNGSISILVKHSNRHGKALKSLTTPLTFVVTSSTKVRISNGRSFADGDLGIVKVRAPKMAFTTDAATLATMLTSQPAAFQVIDQHAAS